MAVLQAHVAIATVAIATSRCSVFVDLICGVLLVRWWWCVGGGDGRSEVMGVVVVTMMVSVSMVGWVDGNFVCSFG